jgi:hypothetical protein
MHSLLIVPVQTANKVGLQRKNNSITTETEDDEGSVGIAASISSHEGPEKTTKYPKPG